MVSPGQHREQPLRGATATLRQAVDTKYTQFSKYIILEILVWDFMYFRDA